MTDDDKDGQGTHVVAPISAQNAIKCDGKTFPTENHLLALKLTSKEVELISVFLQPIHLQL
jgi:hypothetical protein